MLVKALDDLDGQPTAVDVVMSDDSSIEVVEPSPKKSSSSLKRSSKGDGSLTASPEKKVRAS